MLPVAGEGLDGAEVAVMTLLVLLEAEGLVLLPELPEEEPEGHSHVSVECHTKWESVDSWQVALMWSLPCVQSAVGTVRGGSDAALPVIL